MPSVLSRLCKWLSFHFQFEAYSETADMNTLFKSWGFQKLQNSTWSTIKWISESSAVQRISESLAVQRISESSAVQRISESSAVQWISESSVVQRISESSAVQWISESWGAQWISESLLRKIFWGRGHELELLEWEQCPKPPDKGSNEGVRWWLGEGLYLLYPRWSEYVPNHDIVS